MSSFRVVTPFVVAMAVAVAACGSNAKADPAANLALAQRASIVDADVPGYSSTPHTASADLPAPAREGFARCLGSSVSMFDDTVGAQLVNSATYASGQTRLHVTVKIDPRKSDTDYIWDVMSRSAAAACLLGTFEAVIKNAAPDPKSVTFAGDQGSRFDIGVGGTSVGYGVNFTAGSSGQATSFYADVIFAQRSRAEIVLVSSDAGSAPDRALEIALVQKVYDRIGNGAS